MVCPSGGLRKYNIRIYHDDTNNTSLTQHVRLRRMGQSCRIQRLIQYRSQDPESSLPWWSSLYCLKAGTMRRNELGVAGEEKVLHFSYFVPEIVVNKPTERSEATQYY
jgi:hypothetical protein